MENNGNLLQIQLFDQITKILPGSISLVDEIAHSLDISIDSAYRRLRGETPLNINELKALCNRYHISFDSICLSTENSVTFDFQPMTDVESYKNYLVSVLNSLKQFRKKENIQAIYAAKDIPLFYDFSFPLIASFKVFYWMKFIMNIPSFQGIKFNPAFIDNEIIAIGKEIYNSYASIPSIEIWTEVTSIGLLKQVEYFWDAGIFKSKEDALGICNEVEEEFVLIEQQAEIGQKLDSKKNRMAGENSYLLYWSEIEFGNNCIYVDIEDEKIVFLAFNTFNRLLTRNKNFCNEIEKWLQTLIKKSILISGVSEKQRYKFFRNMNNRIDVVRNKIIND